MLLRQYFAARHRWSLVIAFTLLSHVSSLFAQGALMIDPKRIVLDQNKRTDAVTLYNSGNDTMSYRISFKHFAMYETGELKDVDSVKTDIAFADSMIRIFPRSVRLLPHESQQIRLQFSKPATLQPGEYRTHLYVVENERQKAITEKHADTAKTIGFDIHAIVGIAIPLLVRYQTHPATISLSDLAISDPDTSGARKATFVIHRVGDESMHGSFVLNYKAPDGSETKLSEVTGVSVYVPLARREYSLSYKQTPKTMLAKGGTLRLLLMAPGATAAATPLAVTELPISK